MENRDGHYDKKGLGAIMEYNEEPDLVDQARLPWGSNIWAVGWRTTRSYTECLTSTGKASFFKHQVELQRIQKLNLIIFWRWKEATEQLSGEQYVPELSGVGVGDVSWVSGTDSQGSATLRHPWTFLPKFFPTEVLFFWFLLVVVFLSHRVGDTTLIAEGRKQVNSLPRVTQHRGEARGSWDRCEPWALLLFITCQHLSSPWGAHGARKSLNSPHWASFHQFFSSLILTPCPF